MGCAFGGDPPHSRQRSVPDPVLLQGEPALLEGVLLGEPVSWCL